MQFNVHQRQQQCDGYTYRTYSHVQSLENDELDV